MGQGSYAPTVPVEWSRRTRWRASLVPALSVVDGVALLVGLMLVGQVAPVGWVFAAVALALLVGRGGYRGRINPRLSDDLPGLLGLLAFPVLLLAPFFPSSELGAFIVALPLIVVIVLVGRGAMYWLMRVARRRGLIVERTLVVGTGRLGSELANTLRGHPEYGLLPIGFIGGRRQGFGPDDQARAVLATDPLPLPLMGPVHELARVVQEQRIQRVIVGFDHLSEQEMIPVLRGCDRLPVEIHVVPRFFELGVAPDSARTDDVWGVPLLRLRRSAFRSFGWRSKRAIDVVLASLLLVLTAPILFVAVVAVRATSPGPIFFRQVRVGQRGQTFRLLKLRTLYVNDDGDTSWTTKGDSRVTPVGRFLRRTCIDELPQLMNVLRGKMSFVGPRPERPYFADQFRVAITGYGDRERVPGGVTGWAQVHGLRGDTSIAERARFDNHYVEHWSIWRDAVILARTIGTVLRGKGY